MEARADEGWKYERTERRIARWTLVLGAAAGALTFALYTWRWGLGLFVGAVLAWVNFRWLKDAIDALIKLSIVRADVEKPRVSAWTWVRFFGRYALIGLIVYVIFVGLNIPVLSMLAGLCALGAATMAASVYEILRPAE
jgi:hypothetical protein